MSYPPLAVIDDPASKIERVDCGTCPVSRACAIEQGGNGFTFSCCGSTGYETFDANGDPLLLLIDCARHRFRGHRPRHEELPVCPLCDGGIIDDVLNKLTDPCEWVPTVYAKVPVQTRLDVWRSQFPGAFERYKTFSRRKETL